MVAPVETPTPQEIAAALIAYDNALHDVEPITTAARFEAMRQALQAAAKLKG